MPTIFLRTLILYILLTVVFRCLGKRQVGELDMSELVSTLLLSEIASLPIDDPDIPLLYAVVPIVMIAALEVVVTFAKTRCNPLKRLFESKPILLVDKGVIREEELRRMRMTLDELLSECRLQGVGDIGEVYYAIMEQNGKLSVLPKADKKPVTPSDMSQKVKESGMLHALVIDGTVNREEAQAVGIDEQEVAKLCRKQNLPQKDILLLGLDDAGKVTVVKKQEQKKKKSKTDRGKKA